VDRGSQSILAQQVKEVPTILLKATQIVLAKQILGGHRRRSIYAFDVCYEGKPGVLVHYFPINNKATTAMYANGILDNQRVTKGIEDHKWKTDAAITGIYIKSDVMFYQVSISNNSPVDYTIDLIRFYIRDKKKTKRTAVQETELKPVYIVGNTKLVKANSNAVLVFAVEKFTVPDAKYMAVQINEKNGGRHFTMRIKNRKIMKAITLPDYK
jgi:conjugative transposon TraN protein